MTTLKPSFLPPVVDVADDNERDNSQEHQSHDAANDNR